MIRALLVLLTMLAGCATSMAPGQFLEAFPKATKSRFVEQLKAKELIDSGTCQVRIADRKYLSPIGLTVGEDLRGGAKGVDEWVSADGGNAYAVKTYDWVPVTLGEYGGTQLVIVFDTLLCN